MDDKTTTMHLGEPARPVKGDLLARLVGIANSIGLVWPADYRQQVFDTAIQARDELQLLRGMRDETEQLKDTICQQGDRITELGRQLQEGDTAKVLIEQRLGFIMKQVRAALDTIHDLPTGQYLSDAASPERGAACTYARALSQVGDRLRSTFGFLEPAPGAEAAPPMPRHGAPQDNPTKIMADAFAFEQKRQGEIFSDLRACLDLIQRLASELAWLREVLAGGGPINPKLFAEYPPEVVERDGQRLAVHEVVSRLNKLHEGDA